MSENYLATSSQNLEQYGVELASKLLNYNLIYLSGELGAGKTTLTRGILHGFGYSGLVKSPTYTLVETYNLAKLTVHHFDLYRLNSPYELEEMGFRDYFNNMSLIIIEWPEKATLPAADLIIQLKYHSCGRELTLIRPNK